MGFWDSVKSIAGSAVGDVEKGWDAVTSGAWTAPTPQVNSSPPPPHQPGNWTAPDPSAKGQLMVQTDALNAVADSIRSYLPDLEQKISKAKGTGSGINSLSFWSAGAQITQNMLSTADGFDAAAKATSDTHTDAAKALNDNASTYEDTEQKNARSAQNINSQLV